MHLGIFGGSFDPVHHGHLLLAECCADQAALDEVWFVPNAQQPLKPAGSTANDQHRLAMLQLACQRNPKFKTSTVEIDRGGISYTVDTLEALHREHADAELFFLMGADALKDLPKWHRPEAICRIATPLVVHRAETPVPDFDVLSKLLAKERLDQIRQHQVEMPPTPISSSQIRSSIASDGDWQPFVPEAVADYIVEHSLYTDR